MILMFWSSAYLSAKGHDVAALIVLLVGGMFLLMDMLVWNPVPAGKELDFSAAEVTPDRNEVGI